MPIVTWDHVHLRSPDPEATAAWLENILGGVIIRGPGRIDVKLGGANVFIAPVTAGDGVNTPPVTPYQGLDHFGLTVKDIDAVAAEIKAKGVEFTKEPTTIRPGVRICFIRGPAGHFGRAVGARQEICVSATLASSGHAARHEAADVEPAHTVADRPDHGSSDPVRLGDDGFVRYVDPLAVDAHAIVAIAAFPIGVADR